MAVRDIVVRLRADVRSFEREMDRAGSAAARQQAAMRQVGMAGLAMGAVMAGGLLVSAKAAMEWESAWAGVTKTVDGSAEQMKDLEGTLREMATRLPASATEIAKVAEAAGQLGVKRQDIAAFSETMIALGVSTNLTSDDAATAIARIANVMGTFDKGPDAIQRFGAALVDLGNNGASTERDILEMSQRLSSVGALVGASETDVLGLANALSSMGVQAELGGGVMTRALTKIYEAVNGGGPKLEGFARIAGTTAEQFAADFKGDPIRAMDDFIKGLDRMDSSGGNVVAALASVGLSGTYNTQVLLALKSSGDLLSESLDMGAEAWRTNVALTEEAGKRYETTASKMKIAKNQANELLIDLGTHLLPVIQAVSEGVGTLASALAALPEPVQQALVIAGTLAATLGLLGGAAMYASGRITAMALAVVGLGFSARTTIVLLHLLRGALVASGIAVALVVIGTAMSVMGKKTDDTSKQVAKLATSLEALSNGTDAGTLEDLKKLLALMATGGPVGEAGAKGLDAYDKALAQMVEGGNAGGAGKAFEQIRDAMIATGMSAEDVGKRFNDYGDALHAAKVAQDTGKASAYQAAEALSGVGKASATGLTNLATYAKTLDMSKEATEELTKQVEDWGKALAAFVTPMGAYTDVIDRLTEREQANAEKSAEAQNESVDAKIKAVQREAQQRVSALRDSKVVDDKAIQQVEDVRDKTVDALTKQKKGWEDYASAVSVSVDQYLDELERQVAAQTNWQTNMLILSSRVSADTLQALTEMGQEGAPIVAKLVTASDAELARLETVFGARTKAATDAAAAQLYLAGPVLAKVAAVAGKKTAAALAAELASGKTTVAQIAEDYGIVLESAGLRGATALDLFNQKLSQIDGREIKVGLGFLYVDPESPTGKMGAPLLLHPGHAAGGKIRGTGTGTSDSNLRRVSNGEWVVRQSASTMYGDAKMAAVNAGTAQINVGVPVQVGYQAESKGLSEGDVSRLANALSSMGGRQTTYQFHGDIVANDPAKLQREMEARQRLLNLGGGV